MSAPRRVKAWAGALLVAGCVAPAAISAGSAHASFTLTATLAPVSGTGSCRTTVAGQVQCVTPYPGRPGSPGQDRVLIPESAPPAVTAIAAAGADCVAALALLSSAGWISAPEWRQVPASYDPLDRIMFYRPEELCRWNYQPPLSASWVMRLVRHAGVQYLETTLSW